MSDGLWNSGIRQEQIGQSGLSRHRLLRVHTLTPGNAGDASTYASVSPETLTGSADPNGGPHFILSPETPDGRPTLGFEWFLFINGIPVAEQAVPAAAGFSVTIWVLVANTQAADGNFFGPVWASFATQTGVQFNQLSRSFDVNATAIRFQIANETTEGSVMIGMCEL